MSNNIECVAEMSTVCLGCLLTAVLPVLSITASVAIATFAVVLVPRWMGVIV